MSDAQICRLDREVDHLYETLEKMNNKMEILRDTVTMQNTAICFLRHTQTNNSDFAIDAADFLEHLNEQATLL